MMRGDD